MDWLPEEHYGISKGRAIQLENSSYPRGSTAVFHFNKLTKKEQRTVIAHKQKELREALESRKQIYRDARQFANEVNHDKYVLRSMNIHPYYKKENKKLIDRLKQQITKFEASIKEV